VKLREKGKKESQVFTSVADNPRLCVGFLPWQSAWDATDKLYVNGS